MRVTIKVENAYSDGHESEQIETVDVQPFDDIDELWDQLREFTGDGHDIDGELGYCHTVTVVEFPARRDLLGCSNEWVGA